MLVFIVQLVLWNWLLKCRLIILLLLIESIVELELLFRVEQLWVRYQVLWGNFMILLGVKCLMLQMLLKIFFIVLVLLWLLCVGQLIIVIVWCGLVFWCVRIRGGGSRLFFIIWRIVMFGVLEMFGVIYRICVIICLLFFGWWYFLWKFMWVCICLLVWLRWKWNRLFWCLVNRLVICWLVMIRLFSMCQLVLYQFMLLWLISFS